MGSIAVLAGGPSSEHEVSLSSGTEMLKAARGGGHHAFPVYITHEGAWHFGSDAMALEEVTSASQDAPGEQVGDALDRLRRLDATALLALHGAFGEDGQIQRLLEEHDIPYTGCDASASALAMDKHLMKQAAAQLGAQVAPHCVVSADSPKALEFLKDMDATCFVKPVSSGSSVGVSRVDKPEEIPQAVALAMGEDPQGNVMVEKAIHGQEIACSVLKIGDVIRALPLVEVKPEGSVFYDYTAKYDSSETVYLCPADISPASASSIQKYAQDLYREIPLRGAVRVDYILEKDTGIPYFLELNTLPGFTPHSLLPLAADEAGIDTEALVESLLADV